MSSNIAPIKLQNEILFEFFMGKEKFNKYNEVKKNWGKEHWIINHKLYCMKIIEVIFQRRCSVHYHLLKDETFHILNGVMKLELWEDVATFKENKPDKIVVLWPGSSVRIQPGVLHRFEALTDEKNVLQFIEVSTQHHESDSIRVVPAPTYTT